MHDLEQQAQSLNPTVFAEWVALPPAHPRLPTKRKDLLLRWALIQKSWDTAAHTFIPYSLIANEGFCTSCLAAPKNFQSFLRTPCALHKMDSANDALRCRLLAVHKNIQNAQLTAGVIRPPFLPVSVHCGCLGFDSPRDSHFLTFNTSFLRSSCCLSSIHASIAPNLHLAPNLPVLCSEDVLWHALGCVALSYSCTYSLSCTVYILRAG